MSTFSVGLRRWGVMVGLAILKGVSRTGKGWDLCARSVLESIPSWLFIHSGKMLTGLKNKEICKM